LIRRKLSHFCRKINPKGNSEEIVDKKVTSEDGIDSKIDEYGEDPFDGVTGWPLPEMPNERGSK
jgi:hypothetical protein